MKILEQLWNEALNSNKIKKPSHPQYNELLDAADKTEKKLLSLLNEEGKELYYKMNEIRSSLYSMDESEIYKNGFRLGAKIMLEITNADG